MISFIIEHNDEIKETFGYEIPFNESTQQSIMQYVRAHYGPDAVLRNMTDEEKVKLTLQDQGKSLAGESATKPTATK
jgi:hypothetical protein